MVLRSRCPAPPPWCERWFVRGLLEQVTYLLVGRLREALVPEANGEEGLWPDDAHQFVSLRCKFLTRCGCGSRDSDDDAGGLLLPHHSDSCTHGGPGRNPIIDEDDGTTAYVIGWAIPPVKAFASLHLV